VFPDWISTDSSIAREDSWDEVTPALQAAARIPTAIITIKKFFLFMYAVRLYPEQTTYRIIMQFGSKYMSGLKFISLAKCGLAGINKN